MHIDEKSKIQLYAVVACLPFIVGAIMWLTSVDAKASDARNSMAEIKPMVIDILVRIIRIEEQLKRK